MHIIKQLQCLTLIFFLHKRICRTESWCKTHHEFYYEYQKSANFFVLDFRTNKINLRHSHTCWGTKGFSDLHDALNELKEIVLFATLKKKNFSNKNTSLHEKKNEFAFLRTFTKHRRTNGVVYYRHNLAKCLSLKKKINYNRLQKLRNVI